MGPAPCPICHRTLRKQKFRLQTFEDTVVEREVDLRKRIAKTFNKSEEDFSSLKVYNDYLEELENISKFVQGLYTLLTNSIQPGKQNR